MCVTKLAGRAVAETHTPSIFGLFERSIAHFIRGVNHIEVPHTFELSVRR